MGFLSIDSLYFSVHQAKPALTLTIAVVARRPLSLLEIVKLALETERLLLTSQAFSFRSTLPLVRYSYCHYYWRWWCGAVPCSSCSCLRGAAPSRLPSSSSFLSHRSASSTTRARRCPPLRGAEMQVGPRRLPAAATGRSS